MSRLRFVLLLAGLTFLRPGPALCQAGYNLQLLTKSGDPLGSSLITGDYTVLGLGNGGQADLLVSEAKADGTDPRQALVEADAGRLTPIYQLFDPLGNLQNPDFDQPLADANSSGQVVFALSGQIPGPASVEYNVRAFVEYSAGKLSLIAQNGGPAPGGTWSSLENQGPDGLKINAHGDVLFGGTVAGPAGSQSGVFRWDAVGQQVTPVVANGMRTGDNVALERTYPGYEAINDLGQIALFAAGKDATGSQVEGLFLIDPNGTVRPVALAGQALPNHDQVSGLGESRLSNSGVVVFLAGRVLNDRATGSASGNGGSTGSPSSRQTGGPLGPELYRWENGTITATGIAQGARAPGRWYFNTVDDWWVSPQGDSIVAAVHLTDFNNSSSLFRFANGQLAPVVEPGQKMPDGAINAGPPGGTWQMSRLNAAGQLAFVTGLADCSTAAYQMDAAGRLSLLLKSGASTPLGTITRVGSVPSDMQLTRFMVGLNDSGQVALPVQLATASGTTDAVVLLTPQ